MKRIVLILFLTQLVGSQLFSQKTTYFLNKTMLVGCNGANPLTDLTKKITVNYGIDKTILLFASLSCKIEETCTNFGSFSTSKPGILYMNKNLNLGFISVNNEKVILIRKESDVFKITGVAHVKKGSAPSISEETVNYQNELNDFDNILKKLEQNAKIKELNALAVSDSVNTFLDTKPILKDSRGISGIYYSTFPIKLNYSNKYAKKFLINYDESGKRPILYINTQYAYETTDVSKFIKRATFWLDDHWKNVLDSEGFFASSEADNVDNDKYEWYTHVEKKDLQGNSIYGDDRLTNFDGTIYEVEPGIFLIVGDFQDTRSFSKNLDYAKKYGVIAILYKAEKATAVLKYSNDYAWDRVAELNVKIDALGNVTSEKLPTETFKDPKINSEALTLAKDYAAKNHPKEQVQYTYIAGNDWNIVRDKNSGQITKRTLRIIVVVKIGNQCAFENGSITQNYDGSNYGRSIWNGTGAPVYINCKDVKQ